MGQLQLSLLGAPAVRHDGETVDFRTRKALALLVYLAVEDGMHRREKLAALFWPENDASSGRANLRNAFVHLRRPLRHDEQTPHLRVERDRLGFNRDSDFTFDWRRLQEAAHPHVPLVGREAEHRELVAAFHCARQARPQVVVLTGEAGVGKTRLASEFLDWAAAQGPDVLRAGEAAAGEMVDLLAETAETTSRLAVPHRRAQATAARWAGRLDEAAEHLAAAAALAAEMGLPGERWPALAAGACLAAKRGEEERAAALHEEAAEIVEGLAATLDDEEVRQRFLDGAQGVLDEPLPPL